MGDVVRITDGGQVLRQDTQVHIKAGLEQFRRLSDTYDPDRPDMDPEEARAILRDPERQSELASVLTAEHIVDRGTLQSLAAEGGPFDGVRLTVAPGVKLVILPAAMGDGGLRGKVVYERRVRGGDEIMAYVGQPNQNDPEHSDDDPPQQLILP